MFTKTTFSLVACATLVASLAADTLTIDPIVVSATKTEQSLKETTANIDVITSEELEEKHITSVIDALRTFTSISIAQSGGLGQQTSFYQRGFKTENTVVMIDGIRYNDPTTIGGIAQLEHLMVNNIERIEIINGAQSGIWGANAAAGIINIITKKATQKLSLGGNLEYGSYATTKIAADISQKMGALSYYVGVNQLKSNGFSAQTPKGQNPEDYEADGYKNQTVNAKLGYDLTSSDTLFGQFTFIDAKVQYDAYSQPNSTANEIHQIDRLGNIGYTHKLNAVDVITATYAVTAFDKKDPLGYTKEFKGTNKEVNLQGSYHYTDNSFVVAGANTLDSKDTLSSKELDSKGIFLTNTNRLENLILTESIRHDAYDEFNDKTTGKIGAKYFFAEDITLSANYGTAYRVPSLTELYGAYGANPNLTPETTRGYDITAQYKGLAATYFNNKINNLIDYTSGYNNVAGTSTFKGYELKYQQNMSDLLTLNLAYNKLFAKDKDGAYYAKRPHDSAKATIDFYGIEKLMLSTTAQYIGTRHESDYSTFPAGTVQTGRYTLWSAIANYDVTKNTTLYIKGENLTNKLYQEVNGYGTAGRSVYAGLNARF
ncbi:MAG: TonB-dependent receptor domain-containing protein [Sulfuricurvum sp.]